MTEFFFLFYNLILKQRKGIWTLNAMKTQESANKIYKALGISMIWIGFGQVKKGKEKKNHKK